MRTLSVSQAKLLLENLIKEVGLEHEPVFIKGRRGSAILVDEDDWRAIQETLYLLSIPGMREKIKEGMETPLSECAGVESVPFTVSERPTG